MIRVCAIALALSCLAGCARTAQLPHHVVSRALSLPVVGETPFSPRDVDGKVVLINYLATWCFPCVAELPVLQLFQKKYASRGFSVVGIGMDLEGALVLDPFARHYKLQFPVLVADQATRNGNGPFGPIHTLPTNILLGRDGTILVAYTGVADHEELERVIANALR